MSDFSPILASDGSSNPLPGRFPSANRTLLLVLNYRKYSDSINFLQSLLDTEIADADIVILDNASGNESIPALCEWIETNFPEDAPAILDPATFDIEEPRFSEHVAAEYVKGRVAVFSADRNFGFSGGNNAMSYIGRQLGYQFLYFLNSDVLLTDRFSISKLEALHNTFPDAYASGPCVINMDGSFDSPFRRDSFWGDALYYGPVNRIRKLFNMPIVQFDLAALSKPEGAVVYKISGAAMFFPTERFFEIGGLDENVWLSSEEPIMGEKVRKAGGSIMYLPTTVLLHVKASAPRSFASNYEVLANHFRQRNYYYVKYRGFKGWRMGVLKLGQALRLFLARISIRREYRK